MTPIVRDRDSSRLTTLIAMVLVVAVLYWAREVLIPAALAILLCFILAPLANRLERWGLRRVPSVLLTTVLAGAVIVILGWIVSAQVVDLIDQLPSYRQNIREKVRDLRSQASGVFGRATEQLEEITRDVAEAAAEVEQQAEEVTDESPMLEPQEQEPVLVEVQQKPPKPITALVQTISPLLDPLVSAGIVIVFVIFMLLERENLRDRFIRVVGQRRLILTTQAIDEAGSRISRYLVSLLALNVSYGVIVSIALLLIGVPNAMLWGVLTAILRFIPYLGPWLGASLPILLSIAVFDGWAKPLMTIAMFIGLELFSNNVAEPLVYGSRTGISSLAVLTGVLFWTWLWGPVGLILATPLTVCLVVIGRYVPELEPLTVLLGNEPALPPQVRVYQRLLAGDGDDAYRLTEEILREHDIEHLQSEVLLPALLMAERDHHRGAISTEMLRSIRAALRDLLDEIAEDQLDAAQKQREKEQQEKLETAKLEKDKAAKDKRKGEQEGEEVKAEVGGETTVEAAVMEAGAARAEDMSQKQPPLRVLCLPARSHADELACRMFAQSAVGRDIDIDLVSHRMLNAEIVEHAASGNHDLVLISAVAPGSVAAARKMLARLQPRADDRRVVVGLWGAHDMEKLTRRLHLRNNSTAVASFGELLRQLDELAQVPRAPAPPPL